MGWKGNKMPSFVTNRAYEIDPKEPEIIVLFEYSHAEKPVLYDSNEEGYPGSVSSVEIISVMQKGVDIISSMSLEELQVLETECLADYEE